MTEYMIKVRVDDPDGVGRNDVRECMQQLIDEVNGHAPFYFTIDQIDKAMPKSVDDIIQKGICPRCKNESLYEDERSEDYISFLCDHCESDVYVARDDMGIRLVVLTWFDESKLECDDEIEEIIYER
mgnify:CR=1 FL=1